MKKNKKKKRKKQLQKKYNYYKKYNKNDNAKSKLLIGNSIYSDTELNNSNDNESFNEDILNDQENVTEEIILENNEIISDKLNTLEKTKRSRKVFKIMFIILILILSSVLAFLTINEIRIRLDEKLKAEEEERQRLELEKIKNYYNDIVITQNNANVYNESKNIIGEIAANIELELDNDYEIIDKYYKLKNEDLYIIYTDVNKLESLTNKTNEYKTYRNYIPYNLELTTNDEYILINYDGKEIKLNSNDTYQIIIKNNNKYGVEFNNELFYISGDNVLSITEKHYTDSTIATSLPVLGYHYTISVAAGENQECRQSICMTDTQVESEIKYLKENDFYATTLRDVELFVDGMIQLPKKSVTITIDDGWYLARMIDILNRYQMQGTLFLIGSLAQPESYYSEYLEIHSHSWDMHKLGVCNSGTHGGAILCKDEAFILEDLRKSRESLNNTTYYCYPFYEVNERAIRLLQEAGFTMSFIGGNRKVRVGDNKFLLKRYQLVNTTTIDEFISYVN